VPLADVCALWTFCDVLERTCNHRHEHEQTTQDRSLTQIDLVQVTWSRHRIDLIGVRERTQ